MTMRLTFTECLLCSRQGVKLLISVISLDPYGSVSSYYIGTHLTAGEPVRLRGAHGFAPPASWLVIGELKRSVGFRAQGFNHHPTGLQPMVNFFSK